MLKNNRIYKFYEQVTQEIKRIVWPSKKDLIAASGIVLVSVFMFSIICLILDLGIHYIVQFLLNIGK